MNAMPPLADAAEPLFGVVYRIASAATGRGYIGSTSRSIEQRWLEHLHHLRHGRHHSRPLQEVYDREGEADLSVAIVEVVDGVPLRDREQHHIDEHRTDLLNGQPFARSILAAQAGARGRVQPPEERARRSEGMRQACAAGRVPHLHSPEVRAKRAAAAATRYRPRSRYAACFAAHRAAGRTLHEIARLFRVERATVSAHLPEDLRRLRSPRREATIVKVEAAKRAMMVEPHIATWAAMRAAGLSFREIERQTGNCRKVIARELRAIGGA